MAEISYEVYVLEGDRWTLESRYSNLERETAVNDAKAMHENPRIKAVKVVKETYDEETNSTVESTVFSTEAAKPLLGKSSSNMADFEVETRNVDYADMEINLDGEGGWDTPAAPAKKKKSKSKSPGKNPIGTIFLKILVITVFSFGFALVMTYLFADGGIL